MAFNLTIVAFQIMGTALVIWGFYRLGFRRITVNPEQEEMKRLKRELRRM